MSRRALMVRITATSEAIDPGVTPIRRLPMTSTGAPVFDPASPSFHDVVAGRTTRPERPRLTVFKSVGMGLSDLAVARLLLPEGRR
jgi:hypothetical protein